MNNDDNNHAIQALKDIALEGLKEQRRARRWGIFFKFMLMLYLLGGLLLVVSTSWRDLTGSSLKGDKITAVVDIDGAIMPDSDAGADLVIPSLRKAFADPKTKAVLLRINSPGGSPVQSGYINDEIQRLKKNYDKVPVYAVVADMCASGGYYIAVAADKIYVDKASIVGSIGVRMDSFGAVAALEKLGIERRLYTAGTNKGMLDPFLPENAQQVDHVKSMLAITHQQFINVVKQGRGARLKETPEMFSGLFWTGETAVELGLADGLGSASYVAREVVGAENMVNFSASKDVFQRLTEKISLSLKSILYESSAPSTQLY